MHARSGDNDEGSVCRTMELYLDKMLQAGVDIGAVEGDEADCREKVYSHDDRLM